MLSIIVLSSDGYSDCWIPYFTLLKENFKDVDKHEIILSTNTKSFEFADLDISVITHGKKAAWSKRLKTCIQKAKNDIVMVMAEDMFLRSPMDTQKLDGFLKLMSTSKDIDHIRLLSTRDRTKVTKSNYDYLDKIEAKTKLRFLFLPGLWKKHVILKYVVGYETPFTSERLGDPRSWILKHEFYAVTIYDEAGEIKKFYDCQHSGALFKGKWEKWAGRYFKDHNVKIDFEERGFVTDEFAKKSRIKSKLQLLTNPIDTFRSFFSVLLLYIKVKIFRFN